MIKVYESRYKDQPAITIESEKIVAQFLPGIGAKLASLVYKPAGLELLVQRPNEEYLLAPYDGDYVAQGECSGFDEMFPSIDKCFYEGYPWRGTPIPDHGEVWSIPWAWESRMDGFILYPRRAISVSAGEVGCVCGRRDVAYRLPAHQPFCLRFRLHVGCPPDVHPGRRRGAGAAG